jgi:hypothetical protein
MRKFVGLLAVLLACFGLCGSIQAVERNTVGGRIIVYRGGQTQEVDFAPKPDPPAPMLLPSIAHHQPGGVSPVLAPRPDDPPQPQLPTDSGKQTSDQSWTGRNVLRVSEQVADIGLAAATMYRADPPPAFESTVAIAEPAAESSAEPGDCEPVEPDSQACVPEVQPPPPPQPAAPATFLVWPPAVQQAFDDHHRAGNLTAPAPQPAAPSNSYSALEIVSLSVGISFALSLVAIWLVVIAVQRWLPQPIGSAPWYGPAGHDPRPDLSGSACQNTAPAGVPDRRHAAAQRETHIVDLAHDALALAPVAAEYQQRRQDEQQRRHEQQTAILERIYQDNVALQLAPRPPAAVPAASC